jgi:hypothetical protein
MYIAGQAWVLYILSEAWLELVGHMESAVHGLEKQLCSLKVLLHRAKQHNYNFWHLRHNTVQFLADRMMLHFESFFGICIPFWILKSLAVDLVMKQFLHPRIRLTSLAQASFVPNPINHV